MPITATLLNKKRVPGVGLHTSGTLNFSGNYPAGGEPIPPSLSEAGMHGAQFNIGSGQLTAMLDNSTKKIRVFNMTTGAMVELTAAAAYPGGTGSITFTSLSR